MALNQAPTKKNSTQVVIITGDTGSGKTTQVAQYILEEAASAGENDFNNILEGMLSTIFWRVTCLLGENVFDNTLEGDNVTVTCLPLRSECESGSDRTQEVGGSHRC